MVQIFQCNPWYGHEFCEVRHSSYFGRNAWASHQHRSVSQQDLRYYPTHGNLGGTGYGYQYGYDYFFKRHSHFLGIYGSGICSTWWRDFCLAKFLVALAISVTMNSIFAPVFMTLHKITDTHIGIVAALSKRFPPLFPWHVFSPDWIGRYFGALYSKRPSFVLVSGPHHHFPASSGHAGIICRHSRVVLGVLLAIAAKKE